MVKPEAPEVEMTQTTGQRPTESMCMPADQSSRTSVTLLSRLRQDPRDQAAWNEFVARYEPTILQWCLRWRLQESDARDVTQDVLLNLQRSLPKFAYDPSRSFRGWLRTLTHHAWRDLIDDRKRPGLGSGDTGVQDLLESVAAGNDLVEHLEKQFHRELVEQAMALVQPRVAARTWDAFRLTAIEGLSGATAADRLEMNIARVYSAKSQVKTMIREEIRKLYQVE
jgi:RNA polymerase sigma factor (sigma-70 family)